MRPICWVVVVVLACAGGCAGERRPHPATDQSSPRAAALSYYEAVERGEAATAKRILLPVQQPGDHKFVEAMADVASVHRRIRDAAIAQFRVAPDEVDRHFMMMPLSLGASHVVRRAEIRVKDSAAEVLEDNPSNDVHTTLVRRSGEWYVVLPEEFRLSEDGTARMAADFKRVSRALAPFAPAMRAGRYRSLDDAADAYQKVLEEEASRASVAE